MEQIPWLDLFSQLFLHICTLCVIATSLAVLALCLQLSLLRHARFLRALTGVALTTGLMLVAPLIYFRPKQHMAVGLATVTCMAALTTLDWCLLQPSDAAPSVSDVLSSLVWQTGQPSYSKQQKYLQSKPQQRHDSNFQKIRRSVPALLRVMVLIDVMSAVLECLMCCGEPSTWQDVRNSSSDMLPAANLQRDIPALASAAAQVPGTDSCLLPPHMGSSLTYFLATIAAGILVMAQLEFTYMIGRIGLILSNSPCVGTMYMFDKPWMAVSLSDLWSHRWHQLLRYYFTGLGYSLADCVTSAVTAVLNRIFSSIQFDGSEFKSESGFQGSNTSGARTKMPSSRAHIGISSSNGCGSSSIQGHINGQTTDQYFSSDATVAAAQQRCPSAAASDLQESYNPQLQQQQQQKAAAYGSNAEQSFYMQLKPTMRTLFVFAISGLVHEYVTWAAFGVWTWSQLTFFMLHGLAVITENLGSKMLRHNGYTNRHIPTWLGRAWVLGFAAWTAPQFLNVYMKHGHFQNYIPPFVWPVTSRLLTQYGLCSCN